MNESGSHEPQDSGIAIPGEWTFRDSHVAQGFDQHVREQLPWYDLVTSAVAHIARHYIPHRGQVYDIGCSTGNIGRALAPVLEAREASLVGIEAAREMIERYDAPGEVVLADAVDYDYCEFDLAICFLSIMFMPVRQRPQLIARLRQFCRPGGALIILDKCQPLTGWPATVLWRMTLEQKVRAGVSADEIIRKELSLSGVQRPIDPAVLGSNAVEWFRFGDFAGWLIERPH